MVYGAALLLFFVLFLRKENASSSVSPALVFFLCLMGYEILRASLAGVRSVARSHPYLTSPLSWSFYLGFLALSFSYFRTRRRAQHLLWVLVAAGFFLALNAIPFLLTQWRGFLPEGGQAGFFHPLFLSWEPLSKYLFSRFVHPNYTGDIMALGLFPALALFSYQLRALRNPEEREKGLRRILIPIFFTETAASVIALAVISFLSRGTIISLSVGLSCFLLGALTKFPSRAQWVRLLVGSFIVVGILLWAGSLPSVWKELATLQLEMKSFKEKIDLTRPAYSGEVSLEGGRRALAIYRAHPIWGVGTHGYPLVSESYATPGTEGGWGMGAAKFSSLCYYLQLLAEEGLGAYLYFLFLLAYGIEVGRGLFITRSRFQFLAALSLVSGVLMILFHAAFGVHMERFSTSMLTYILMGASLGILRKDFKHV